MIMGMILSDILRPEYIAQNPWVLLPLAFHVWMLVDAIRRQEYIWAFFIFIFPLLNAIIYFFLVYRASPSDTQGFELPGAFNRQRMKELQGAIHHLDKAHHHAELGDIYFQQGKLKEAENCYREAISRDNSDIDFKAHLGQCLLRQGRAEEARPLLEEVLAKNAKHDYSHTMMAYAETLEKLGDKKQAITVWEKVLEGNSYARARVQLAELYAQQGESGRCQEIIEEFLKDEMHTTSFQQRRDRTWIKRAKKLATSQCKS